MTFSGSNTNSGSTTVDGGTLQIVSGLLTSPTQYVGYSATGTLLQSGGVNTLTSSGQLYLGYNPGSSGTYNLSGSGQLSASYESIGYSGTGNFIQSGGVHTITGTSGLYLGYNPGSSGSYNLSGNGVLP